MNNSRFSSFIYKVIGLPERWHDDYQGLMDQVLSETSSIDNPENFSELEIGENIIGRLHSSNEALAAFSTLLDKSMFKLIILDKDLTPMYHNQAADELIEHLSSTTEPGKLKGPVINKIEQSRASDSSSVMRALNLAVNGDDQIYLRTIKGDFENEEKPLSFYLLLAPDKRSDQNTLNEGLVDQFELTAKEQKVLSKLIEGKNIKEISAESFVSENTVKTHLKSIYRKTGTNSQADVIRLVLLHESQVLDSYFDSTAQLSSVMQEFSSEDKKVTLSDGNYLVYREYGPADGRPLIIFHNNFGCRLTIPYDYEEILRRTNRRIIIPDRPGYGKTPFVDKHPACWNDYVSELVTALELTQYDIMGCVLSSQLAINYAASADEKLAKVILASPVIVNDYEYIDYLNEVMAPCARLVKASSRLAREIYQLWLKSMTLNIKTRFGQMTESGTGSAEKKIFAKNKTMKLLIDSFRESSRVSLKGMSHELVFCMTPLNLDLTSISQPVDIWYGTEDGRISLEGVQRITQELPQSNLFVREGCSEHIYHALFEEIIS